MSWKETNGTLYRNSLWKNSLAKDSHKLYHLETDTHASALGAHTMSGVFDGLIDVGNTQKLMIAHLFGTLEHIVVLAFDADR